MLFATGGRSAKKIWNVCQANVRACLETKLKGAPLRDRTKNHCEQLKEGRLAEETSWISVGYKSSWVAWAKAGRPHQAKGD